MDPYLLKMALIAVVVLGCIGLVFGIGLAMAAQKFAVKVNPKVEEVVEVAHGAGISRKVAKLRPLGVIKG